MMSAGLRTRVGFLLDAQNSDGGWGYFPGKASWLEPTAWAALALTGRPESGRAVDSAFELIRFWQLSEGACRPSHQVNAPSWATALWVTLHCARGVYDRRFDHAVEWMVEAKGAEGSWWRRAVRSIAGIQDEFNPAWCGWAWWPGTSSWLEPTVHSLVALRKVAAAGRGSVLVRDRIAEAERMLLDRRCVDGGWNYGVREALGQALPSYPETTGLALVGLAGRSDPSLGPVVARARVMRDGTRSGMARGWLALALRAWGEAVADPEEIRSMDVMLAAVEALAAEGGNYRLLYDGPTPARSEG